MPTPPDQVRSGLAVVTAAAAADTRAVAAAAESPQDVRAALFAAAPLIVSSYSDGSAALALDWYEEIREESPARKLFTPRPLVAVTDDDVAAVVAQTTESLREIQRGVEQQIEEAVTESLRLLEDETQRLVADAFRATMTGNVADDPDAVGWRRFARPEACKFCLMLAAKGAVYTEDTARFAAHSAVMSGNRKGGNCMCIASPEFGGPDGWEEATPLQYVASSKNRTPEQKAALRDYLNENFPDAPG